MLSATTSHPLPTSPRSTDLPVSVGGSTWTQVLEASLLLGFFLFYLFSFSPSSAVNGPTEIFGQDSVYILKYLDQARPYRWNPQSHLLYHVVVEQGFRVWKIWAGPGIDSTYRYLKFFTALCGLGFLLTMRWLFRELRLSDGASVVLLLLTGVSVSAWFHFAAFETHSLALPMLGLYLVALARMRGRPIRSRGDRLLLIAALVLCGLTRVDLFRFAATSGLLVFLPPVRQRWRTLVVDLAIVGLLAVGGSTLLAKVYFGELHNEAASSALQRHDRGSLKDRLWRVSNLSPGPLWEVGRAVSLYSLLMPVEPSPAQRSFFALPRYDHDPLRSDRPKYSSTGLFLQPMLNLADNALSLLALTATLLVFGWTIALTARRIVTGDPFHTLLAAQVIGGWLFYTLFNPFEPFLWIVEFVPFWIAMLADHSRGRDRQHWIGLAALALLVATHNFFAFYLPFR